jgi:DNA-binding NarL/FixJ family response regulator
MHTVGTPVVQAPMVVASMRSRVEPAWPHPLTAREREVIECIIGGQSTAQMAQQLGVRQSTARSHVRSVLTKMGVSSRLEVAAVITATRGPGQGDLDGRLAERLTAREIEVLCVLMKGTSRKATAEELHLSPNTVRTHVNNILRKLNCRSVLSAVAVARVSSNDRG